VLDPAVLGPLVVVLAVVLVVLIAIVVALGLRLRRLAADQRRAFDGVEVDVLATLARHARRLDGLDAAVDEVRTHSLDVREQVGHTLSRIGVVRYDAFGDAGGELSFSAAILDEHDDGVVLTSISGRASGRTYLKTLVAGEGTTLLSDEERQAVTAAQEGRSEQRVTVAGKRTWRRREAEGVTA
jgi:hypothetical protein